MSLSREQWKKRLTDAEIPEDVVDALLADLKDEDLARMKEDLSAEDLVDILKDAASADDESDEDTQESPPDTEETQPDQDVDAIAEVFKSMEDRIVERVTTNLEALQIEVEVPQLQEVITTVKEVHEDYTAIISSLKEMQELWDEVLKGDTERLKEMLDNLSPAQRIRLKTTLTDDLAASRVQKFKQDKEQESNPLKQKERETDLFHAQRSTGPRPIVRDAQGNEYEDLGALAVGQPKK